MSKPFRTYHISSVGGDIARRMHEMNYRADSSKQRKKYEDIFERCLTAAVAAPQCIWMCGGHEGCIRRLVFAKPLDCALVDVFCGGAGL